MEDGHHDHPPLVEEVLAELRGVHAADAHVADRAGHRRVEARVDDHSRLALEPLHPSVAQVAQAGRLALQADRLLEDQGLRDRVVVRRGVGADLLELADVVVHGRGGGHEGPEGPDLRLAHVEEAGAVGGEQPLVQAGAVVVAVEVAGLEGEVGEGVGAVHHHLDAARVGQGADLLHGEDLAGEVRHVAEVDDPRPRGDGPREAVHDVLHREGGGTGNEIVLSTIPSRRSRCRQVVSIRG